MSASKGLRAKYTLRLSPALHQRLKDKAEQRGMKLNDLLVGMLSQKIEEIDYEDRRKQS